MKKCPRCHYDITDDDKYCPHCGLDLQRQYRPIHRNTKKKPNLPMTILLYGIILLAFIAIPFMYSQFLGTLGQELTSEQVDNTALPDIGNATVTSVIQEFDTLADYNKKYSNVSKYVTNIQNYENSLSEKSNYTFDKQYTIQVLNNYNVLYKLVYTTQISDQYELTIVKTFDRAHSYNQETTTLKKKNVQSFDELIFNDEEEAMINTFVNDESSIHQVIQEFSSRKDEFNEKKEKLGHYGLGTYQDNVSFVVYRYDNVYQSELEYKLESKDYLG